MTISPSISHKTKRTQELIITSGFNSYSYVLPKVLSPCEYKIAVFMIKKGTLHEKSRISRKTIAKESGAGCSVTTVSRTISLLRRLDIIDVYYSYNDIITFKLGLYFKQPNSIFSLSSLFTCLKATTPVLVGLISLFSLNMLHSKGLNKPPIYLKANSFVSNTSKEHLRSSKNNFSDPPLRKSMPFIPQGTKHNESLYKQAIERNQKLDDAMPYEEAKEKLRRYRQMLYAAQNESEFPDAAQQRVIDVYQREVNKWEQRVCNLNPVAASLLESPKETINLPKEERRSQEQYNPSKYDEYFR